MDGKKKGMALVLLLMFIPTMIAINVLVSRVLIRHTKILKIYREFQEKVR